MGMGSQRHTPAVVLQERHDTHCLVGDWLGPRAGLDGCGIYRPHRD